VRKALDGEAPLEDAPLDLAVVPADADDSGADALPADDEGALAEEPDAGDRPGEPVASTDPSVTETSDGPTATGTDEPADG